MSVAQCHSKSRNRSPRTKSTQYLPTYSISTGSRGASIATGRCRRRRFVRSQVAEPDVLRGDFRAEIDVGAPELAKALEPPGRCRTSCSSAKPCATHALLHLGAPVPNVPARSARDFAPSVARRHEVVQPFRLGTPPSFTRLVFHVARLVRTVPAKSARSTIRRQPEVQAHQAGEL